MRLNIDDDNINGKLFYNSMGFHTVQGSSENPYTENFVSLLNYVGSNAFGTEIMKFEALR